MADPLAETSQLLHMVPHPPFTGTSRAGALEHQKTDEADLEPKNSLTSPIDIIPPEVLGYIFTLTSPVATPSSPTIPVLGVHTQREPWVLTGPWVLGQVCREWRALVIAFPVLWTSMVVADNIRPRERHLLDIQLERSGNAPLDLIIRTRFGRNFGRKTPFDGFMQKLAGDCGRWRSLHLQFDGPCPLHWAFDTLGPLPLLRELILSGATDVATLDAFKDAPNLRKVALSNPGQTSIHDTPLPWAQLATYKATYPDGSKHFRNLSMACNLVECDLDFGTQTTDQLVRHMGTLTLSQLRRLVITKDLFLDCLVAPALNELQVHGTIDRVLPFLRRSACILTCLTLFRCNAGTDTEVLQILRNTPSLNHLALDFRGPSSSTNGLISAFMMHPGGADGASVCPNLTSLFWGDRNDTMDRSDFVDMVESRWRASDPTHRGLHFVRVFLGRLRMRSRRLQMFAEEGLDVIVLNSRKGNRAMELWREY